MFFLLILAAGVAVLVCGVLVLVALAWLQVGPFQRLGLDDATTLLHAVASLGAAGFALWAPRSRFGWIARLGTRHRLAGRVLASMLVLYAVYWAGYFTERQFDESVHQASAFTLLVALSGALALYVLDRRSSRAG